MNNTVDIPIPVDPETARLLENPVRREAAGRFLNSLINTRHFGDLLAEAIVDLKREAHANGLTDEMVDAELAAWRAERRA